MILVPYKIIAIRTDDDDSGKNIVPFASVSVKTLAGVLVTEIYQNNIGSIPKGNPFILNANGQGDFWVAPGFYNISIAGGAEWPIFLSSSTTEDFTSTEKTKLAGIQTGATANATNAQLRDRATHTGTQAISTVIGLQSALDSKLDDAQLKTNLSSPDNTSIPSTLAVASAIADSMAGETPRGAWNASTNTPALASSVGTAGYWYEVSVAGTTNLNGEASWQVGDKAIFNGIIWTRIPANAVKSVDGRTGAVILNYDSPAQAALASLPVGAKYSTKGANAVGDGGRGDFIVEAASGTPDGYSRVLLANGNHGVLQPVNGVVNPRQFGAALDGVTDDTTALMRAHGYANSLNLPVEYNCASFAVDADARIPVNTSVDFNGAEIIPLNGFVETPTFSYHNTIFIVADPDCPVITTTGAITASNLKQGSLSPTLGLFDGHGYAEIECPYLIPNRQKTGTVNYTQSFKVNRLGIVSHPLSVDLQAHAANITVSYRKTSKSRVVIEGVNCTTSPTWNNQCIVSVDRCNVEINNTTVLFDDPATFNNVCRLIAINRASDVSVNNFVTTGRPVSTSSGSYCLEINGGADIYVNKMNALTGWGATGTNNINGVYFDHCVLNRCDVHASGHNMFVSNSALHSSGVAYGWGGGVISVTNCDLYDSPAIISRSDYSGQFFGSMIVNNVRTTHNGTLLLRVVDLATNPIGANAVLPVTTPYTITINNVERLGVSTGLASTLCPLDIKVLGTSVVYAPRQINIDDIRGIPEWRFMARIDWRNMEAAIGSYGYMRVNITNVKPYGLVTNLAIGGLTEYPVVITPSTNILPKIFVHGCDYFAISLSPQAGGEITVTDTNLTALKLDNTVSQKPEVMIDRCRLSHQSVAGDAIGCSANGAAPSGYTVIYNTVISARDFDLSRISAMSGVLIQAGAAQPTLPAGATAENVFTGWKNRFSS